MNKHYVTFGSNHIHVVQGKKLGPNVVARFDAPSPQEGREYAFQFFGPKFSFEYSEIDWKEDSIKYFSGGYVDLDSNLLNKTIMSKGEEIIGPINSTDPIEIKELKEKAIDLINHIEKIGKNPRRKALAFTQIETATMLAVKSYFT